MLLSDFIRLPESQIVDRVISRFRELPSNTDNEISNKQFAATSIGFANIFSNHARNDLEEPINYIRNILPKSSFLEYYDTTRKATQQREINLSSNPEKLNNGVFFFKCLTILNLQGLSFNSENQQKLVKNFVLNLLPRFQTNLAAPHLVLFIKIVFKHYFLFLQPSHENIQGYLKRVLSDNLGPILKIFNKDPLDLRVIFHQMTILALFVVLNSIYGSSRIISPLKDFLESFLPESPERNSLIQLLSKLRVHIFKNKSSWVPILYLKTIEDFCQSVSTPNTCNVLLHEIRDIIKTRDGATELIQRYGAFVHSTGSLANSKMAYACFCATKETVSPCLFMRTLLASNVPRICTKFKPADSYDCLDCKVACAISLFENRKFKEAITELLKIQDYPDAAFYLFKFLLTTKNTDQAMPFYEQAKKSNLFFYSFENL